MSPYTAAEEAILISLGAIAPEAPPSIPLAPLRNGALLNRRELRQRMCRLGDWQHLRGQAMADVLDSLERRGLITQPDGLVGLADGGRETPERYLRAFPKFAADLTLT